MASQWDTWLRELRAAGKGGERYSQLTIDRGLAYSKTLAFGMDLSADTFTASLKASPDGPALSPAIDFTVTVGSYSGGQTLVTLALSAATTATIPADADADGIEEFPFDLLRRVGGAGDKKRFIAGLIPVAGKVTNA